MMLQFAYDFWRLKEDFNAEKEIARIETFVVFYNTV